MIKIVRSHMHTARNLFIRWLTAEVGLHLLGLYIAEATHISFNFQISEVAYNSHGTVHYYYKMYTQNKQRRPNLKLQGVLAVSLKFLP